MQRLHVLLRPHERTVVHAAAGLSLLDLEQEKQSGSRHIQPRRRGDKHRGGWGGSRLLTNQGRPSGGRVLPTVAAVDAMPLDQLVGRGVRPEMVRRLDSGVLQSTRPNCGNMGRGGGGFQSVFSMSE